MVCTTSESPAFKAPFATSSEPFYGEVPGSHPNWHGSNFSDRGRRHLPGAHAELGTGASLSGTSQAMCPRSARLVSEGEYKGKVASHAPPFSVPALVGANQDYYNRRALSEGDPGSTYRRTTRYIPPPQIAERPGGRRFIPEPFGAVPKPSGIYTAPSYDPSKVPETQREPAMPRSARPPGATILRESDQELSYEHAFGRKVRVNLETYRGHGRAGDLSQTFEKKPEDSGTFFKNIKDSSTYTRFVSSLPPPLPVSPHQRRIDEERRKAEAQRDEERRLVSTLTLPDENFSDDDH